MNHKLLYSALCLLIVGLAACVETPAALESETAVAISTPQTAYTAVPPTEMAKDDDEDMAVETAVSTTPITDEEATQLMHTLAFESTAK
ncbi:MAG: hypothetical protein GY943_31260, partial [Chloroflexi bacterium]|nr:hypothetical protein [Chloroflexota bacterium]